MKIALDSWALSSRFRHQGTYVYARNLITEFKKLVFLHPDIQFFLFTSPGNSNDAGLIEAGERFELAPAPLLRHDRLWRLLGATRAAAQLRADLIFAPTLGLFPSGSIPLVCMVHDVTPVLMPSHSRKVNLLQRFLLWLTARRALAIITNSQCSKRDLLKLYRLPDAMVKVIYLGYDKAIFNDLAPDPELEKNLRAKLGLHRPYILHHGVIQPRKNLKRLIEAFRLMRSRNANLKLDLVLAGALGWNYLEVLEAARDDVLLPGVLDGPDLAMLVKGASLVVMPSLYEGFCLPMVESMACGVPVIAANTSCLPEISGGVLQYFNPYSIEEMAGCMEKMLENEELKNRLIREGKQRAAFFDWRRCAEETLAVLMDIDG